MPREAPIHRKLAAIVAADVVSYSRFMEADEVGTLRLIQTIQKACIAPVIGAYRGRLIKTTGDGFLFEFSSAVEATLFALALQQRLLVEMEAVQPEKRLVIRIGVHAGDILSDGADMFGDGVNVAARLETLCVPGGICMSAVVQQQLHGKLDLPLVDLGHHQVKNITRAIHVFGLDAAAIGNVASVAPVSAPTVTWQRSSARILIAASVVCAVIAVLTLWWIGWLSAWPSNAPAPQAFSIAVLPFTSLADDGKPDPLADALVDNLTTDLAISFPTSTVIASASAFSYRGKPIDPRGVGRELGARYLLEGSVQRLKESVRVNVHLVEAASTAQIWSDQFERPIADLGVVQDEITTGIANALSVQLVRIEANRQVGTNPTALNLIFRASALLKQDYSDDHYTAAEALLRQALALAPEDLLATQSLGGLLLSRAGVHLAKQDDKVSADFEEAHQLLDRVRVRNPQMPGLNNLLGFYALLFDKPTEALNDYAKEISVDPSAASAYAGQGLCLIKLGRPTEAVPLIEKSIRLDPRNPGIAGNYQALMIAYFEMSDYPRAIEQGERAHAESPNNADFLFYLAAAHALNDDEAGAKESLIEAQKLDPSRHLEALRRNVTASEPANRELALRLIEGLRRAGLQD